MSDPVETCGHDSEDGWMYLHSKCHTGDPTYVRVKDNTLVIECAQCDKEVATFLLAKEGS